MLLALLAAPLQFRLTLDAAEPSALQPIPGVDPVGDTDTSTEFRLNRRGFECWSIMETNQVIQTTTEFFVPVRSRYCVKN